MQIVGIVEHCFGIHQRGDVMGKRIYFIRFKEGRKVICIFVPKEHSMTERFAHCPFILHAVNEYKRDQAGTIQSKFSFGWFPRIFPLFLRI